MSIVSGSEDASKPSPRGQLPRTTVNKNGYGFKNEVIREHRRGLALVGRGICPKVVKTRGGRGREAGGEHSSQTEEEHGDKTY